MGQYDVGSAWGTRRSVVALAVVALMLVGTAVATFLTARTVHSEQEARFVNQADRLDAAIADRMDAYVQVLRGGLGLFEASDDVSRADWTRYVDTLRLDDRYPGFRSLSYVPAVWTAGLEDFVADAGPVPGGAPYSIKQPRGASGTPSMHAPVLYIAPDRPDTRLALGLDLMLEPVRRQALQRSAATGSVVVTPRLQLVSSTDEEAGFLVLVPVERDHMLQGWLVAAFLAEGFTSGLEVARDTDLDFEIWDGTGTTRSLLTSTAGVDADGGPRPLDDLDDTTDAAFAMDRAVDLPGGSWHVRFVAPPGFESRWAAFAPWLVAVLGLLLTAGVVLLVRGSERWRHAASILDRQSRVLNEARETAEAASLATSTFLATMSHEIRTPLNAVIGANSVLMETPLDDEQRAYTVMIRDSGRHLIGVVNDVLDLSRAGSGRMVLESEVFDLGSCLEIVLDLAAAEAGRKAVDLQLDLQAPRHVVGDVARLRQVLINLVGNAVKFTPEGGQVVVRVFVVETGGRTRDGLVAFEVADNGIGIPAGRLATLFDPYVQADASTSRLHGGTGLGLSIAQHLVEAMGGTITVDSAVGVGSTFRFTVRLPAAPPPTRTPAPATSAEPGRRTSDVRILVAEDDPVSRELIERMIDVLGFSSDVVGDGAAAVAAARRTAYDVVFLDRHMPTLDGAAAARRIRALLPHARIVAISGSLGHDAFGDLADDVVAKPFVLSDLDAALDRATAVPAPD